MCFKLSFKRMNFVISLEKSLNKGILLYDETGASTETSIGRFTFKLKGDEKDGK